MKERQEMLRIQRTTVQVQEESYKWQGVQRKTGSGCTSLHSHARGLTHTLTPSKCHPCACASFPPCTTCYLLPTPITPVWEISPPDTTYPLKGQTQEHEGNRKWGIHWNLESIAMISGSRHCLQKFSSFYHCCLEVPSPSSSLVEKFGRYNLKWG